MLFTYISEIDNKWYAYALDDERNQVYSLGPDCPPAGGVAFAHDSENGIKSVAVSCKTRSGAYRKAKKYGTYKGER